MNKPGYNEALNPETGEIWTQRITYYRMDTMQLISTVSDIVCEDGIRRKARTKDGIADTYFSIPAYVSANGKTVSGYITTDTVYAERDGRSYTVYKFIAYRYGKNWGEVQPKTSETSGVGWPE
jgi:hypothetical protein